MFHGPPCIRQSHCRLRMSEIIKTLLNSYRSDPHLHTVLGLIPPQDYFNISLKEQYSISVFLPIHLVCPMTGIYMYPHVSNIYCIYCKLQSLYPELKSPTFCQLFVATMCVICTLNESGMRMK